MNQEMDNGKMHGGGNITYIPFSRSLPVIMDRHNKNVSKVLYIWPTTLIQKLINPLYKTYDNNLCYGIQNLKTTNPKITIWYKAPHRLVAYA
jgi:hypothetical protein